LDIAIHEHGGPVRSEDIAERQGISRKYLEKLAGELRRNGLIRSKRGPGGGLTLARSPEDVSVGDVVRALEGEDGLVRCGKDTTACPRVAECVMRKVWMEADKAMFDRLGAITIADLVSNAEDCPNESELAQAS
jgi:Rrf2 family protein